MAPWSTTYVGSLVGLLLLVAAVLKLGHRDRLAVIIRQYDVLPSGVAPFIARGLPIVEAVIGVTLVTGFGRLYGGLAGMCVFIGFGVAVTINLLRGRKEIACGCFGPSGSDRLSWQHASHNLVLAGAALVSSGWFESSASVRISAPDRVAGTVAALLTMVVWWLGSVTIRLWRDATSEEHRLAARALPSIEPDRSV